MVTPPLSRIVTQADERRARHETLRDADRTAFARGLRNYRLFARLSQSKLAELAGFDHSYVSRLECGQRTPTREAVGLLADALSLDTEGREALMASAGYLEDHLKFADPTVQRLAWFLAREDVPSAAANRLRTIVAEYIALVDDLTTDERKTA